MKQLSLLLAAIALQGCATARTERVLARNQCEWNLRQFKDSSGTCGGCLDKLPEHGAPAACQTLCGAVAPLTSEAVSTCTASERLHQQEEHEALAKLEAAKASAVKASAFKATAAAEPSAQ